MSDPLVLFEATLSTFNNHTKWDSVRFSRIKQISNTLVGDVGQQFIEKLCDDLGLSYVYPKDPITGHRLKQSPWDLEICGATFELKTATEDVSGSFQFNHIRYHRSYQGLICLGVSPDALLFNAWSKAAVTTEKAGKLVSMEKGANASYKLTKKPAQLKDISEFKTIIEALALDINSP